MIEQHSEMLKFMQDEIVMLQKNFTMKYEEQRKKIDKVNKDVSDVKTTLQA